jgi:hypothetical protein
MNPTSLEITMRRAAAVIGLSASLLLAGPAAAQHNSPQGSTKKNECNPNHVLASLDSKTCPDGTVLQRACCIKSSEKGDKTRCKSFAHCPHRTRS